MQLRNTTKMNAAFTMGMQPDGRELLVVVIKGTFDFPAQPGLQPRLADEQLPLVMADEFSGQPGYSATLAEADFVPTKPKAEVLLNGSAYAPNGKPVTSVVTSLQVGELRKEIRVVGPRVWKHTSRGLMISQAEPFERLPVSYDVAFGGVDDSDQQLGPAAFAANPYGKGFFKRPNHPAIDGRALPNTEELNRPITDPKGNYRPLAYGPVSRVCPPRSSYAGTYDEAWKQHQFPFLPTDFNELYYQSAPADQQLDELRSNELVELTNLTPEGVCRFAIPTIEVPVEFQMKQGELVVQDARLDTLLIESDQRLFSLVWRACLPLKRNVFEVSSALVGKMPRGWYRAREQGKAYYENLHELTSDLA